MQILSLILRAAIGHAGRAIGRVQRYGKLYIEKKTASIY